MWYIASSPALATVELLVHVDANLLPTDLRLVYVDVSDDASATSVETTKLPNHWRSFPAPAELAEIGARWVASGKTLMLRVPSAVVIEESNVLLNPAHPDFAGVRLTQVKDYTFDEHLVKRRK